MRSSQSDGSESKLREKKWAAAKRQGLSQLSPHGPLSDTNVRDLRLPNEKRLQTSLGGGIREGRANITKGRWVQERVAGEINKLEKQTHRQTLSTDTKNGLNIQ